MRLWQIHRCLLKGKRVQGSWAWIVFGGLGEGERMGGGGKGGKGCKCRSGLHPHYGKKGKRLQMSVWPPSPFLLPVHNPPTTTTETLQVGPMTQYIMYTATPPHTYNPPKQQPIDPKVSGCRWDDLLVVVLVVYEVYAYMYICVHACMHVCMHACVYVCVCVICCFLC